MLRSVPSKIALRLALVFAGLLAAEMFLQVAADVFPVAGARISGLKPRYISDPRLDVRGDPHLPEYDEAGFRNEARPSRADIVAIGDSQTEGSGVTRAEAWPQRLGALLERDVYQMAFGGYGPGHYLALADEALALEPHVVLVGVYAGNDLANMYQWVYQKGRDPELASTDSQILTALAIAEQERGPIDHVWRETRDAQKGLYGHPLIAWLRNDVEENAKLVSLYKQLRWHLSGKARVLDAGAQPESWQQIMSTIEGVPPTLLLPLEGHRVRTVLTPGARQRALDTSDPRIAEGFRLTAEALREIAGKVQGRARLVVVLLPTKEAVVAEAARQSGGMFAAAAAVAERERRVRRDLRRMLEELAVEVVDPLGKLSAQLLAAEQSADPDAESPYPESWDGHPGPAGHAAIAAAVAAALNGRSS